LIYSVAVTTHCEGTCETCILFSHELHV